MSAPQSMQDLRDASTSLRVARLQCELDRSLSPTARVLLRVILWIRRGLRGGDNR